MLGVQEIFWFALAALALAITPGQNMAYCVSRSLCQGRSAGLVSLAGLLTAYCVHVFATALGFTALLLTAPVAFELVRFAGAAYLMWLAWKAIRPQKPPALRLQSFQPDGIGVLFCMGFLINLLNPSAILFYLALFPQFLQPARGSIIVQSLQLGAVQICASGLVMGLLVVAMSRVESVLGKAKVTFRDLPRYLMGGTFAALSVRLFSVHLV